MSKSDGAKVLKMEGRRSSFVKRERNILNLYMHATGKSEVPPQYHRWCALALVAASVGDRVYFQKFEHSKLYPNLYIFLIGPSAIGKGQAISFALQMQHDWHNVLNGAATHKALVDRFAEQAPPDRPGYETVWLLHEELGNSIPPGTMGNAFVKALTDWYGRAGETFTDSTRKGGEITFNRPCINWVAGSTEQWLGESISQHDMLSGFFGRVIPVRAEYRPSDRVYMPTDFVPRDYDEVIETLCRRVHHLTRIPAGSEFKMSRHAREIDEAWYLTKQWPTDERMVPFFRRESDLAIKLGMVLSLCRGLTLTIEAEDITRAHELIQEARNTMPQVIRLSSQTLQNHQTLAVEDFIRTRRRWVKRTEILLSMRRFNTRAKELEEMLLDLEAAGVIVSRKKGNRSDYKWVDVGRKFKL